MRTNLWVNPIVFGNNGLHRTINTGENLPTKPVFFCFHSAHIGFFMKKKLKINIRYQFSVEKVIFIFVIRRPVPCSLKNGRASPIPKKNCFSRLFRKVLFCFFSKKLLNEKHPKPHFLPKKVMLIFVARTALPFKTVIFSHKRFFTVSSEPTAFFEQLI